MRIKKLVSAFSALAITVTAIAGLAVTASAYDIPKGQEVKKVYLGSLQQDGSVSPETFDNYTIGSEWTHHHSDGNNFIDIATPETALGTAATPEVDSAPAEGEVPLYVTGSVFRARTRQGSDVGDCFTTYTLGDIKTGSIVFSADFNGYRYGKNDQGTLNYPSEIVFRDNTGSEVLALSFANGSGTRKYQVAVNGGDPTDTSVSAEYRKYSGYGIKDLVINMDTGAVSFVLDCIDESGVRKQTTITANIGTGKTISEFALCIKSVSSTNQDVYMDNAELYTIGAEAGTYNYTVKAMAEDTELQTLASGTAKGGATYSVSGIPEVIVKDGKYYELNDESVQDYTKSYTMNEGDANEVISYVLNDNMMFFDGGANATWTESKTTYSEGVAGSWGNNKNVADLTLKAGEYNVVVKVAAKAGNGSNYRGESIAVNGSVIGDITENASKEYVIPVTATADGTLLSVYGRGTSKATDWLDYVKVIKTGEYIPPAAEATEVAVEDAEGVIALKVDDVALTSTSKPVWTITATDGQEYNKTIKVNAAAQLPTVDSTASLGLIVDNIPDGIYVTATLSY